MLGLIQASGTETALFGLEVRCSILAATAVFALCAAFSAPAASATTICEQQAYTVAGPVPDDPYLPTLNAAANPASQCFVDTVKTDLTTVPASVKSQMKNTPIPGCPSCAGEYVAVGRHLSDAIPGACDTCAAGDFNGLTGAIGFGEYIPSNGIDYLQPPDGVLKHEMGHGFDQTTAVLNGQAASQSPGFTAAWTQDVSEMPESVQTQLDYEIHGRCGTEACGRGEAFAAIFAIRYGGDTDDTVDDLIRQYFARTVAWENNLLPPRLLDAATGSATDLADSGGTVHGSLNPFGVATSYRFEYGTTSSYGSSTPAYDAGSGTGDGPVAADLSGLAPSTTYHYRIVALRYGVPVLYGADAQFTTLAHTGPPLNVSPPIIRGMPAPGVTLVCDPGQWAFFDSWFYSWLRDGVAITGDSPYGAGYLVSTADVGHWLSCKVTAINTAGSTTASSAGVWVINSGGSGGSGGSGSGRTGGSLVAPKLTALRLTPARFTAAKSGASAMAKGKTGTLVSFRLDQAATVTFTVERSQPGRLVKGSCRAPTRANRTARRCTRRVLVKGGFTWAAKAGTNSLRFTGRIAGRKLAPASYQLIARPHDRSGATGQLIRAAFTIRR